MPVPSVPAPNLVLVQAYFPVSRFEAFLDRPPAPHRLIYFQQVRFFGVTHNVLDPLASSVARFQGEVPMINVTRFQEQIFFSTVRIFVPGYAGGPSSIGTGFLHFVPHPERPDREFAFLVSNKHVFTNTKNMSINFHALAPDGGPDMAKTVHVPTGEFTQVYTEHPKPEIDLACVSVSQIFTKHSMFFRYIAPEHFATFQEEDLWPGREVWFIGYPDGRADEIHNLPLMRRGYISSIPTLEFDGQPQFIIDAHVHQGSSGSPVFAELGGQFRMLGVVTQTMIKHAQLKAVPAGVAYGVEQTLGLGVVLKARLVTEVIEAAVAKEMAIYRARTGGLK